MQAATVTSEKPRSEKTTYPKSDSDEEAPTFGIKKRPMGSFGNNVIVGQTIESSSSTATPKSNNPFTSNPNSGDVRVVSNNPFKPQLFTSTVAPQFGSTPKPVYNLADQVQSAQKPPAPPPIQVSLTPPVSDSQLTPAASLTMAATNPIPKVRGAASPGGGDTTMPKKENKRKRGKLNQFDFIKRGEMDMQGKPVGWMAEVI